MSILSTYTIMSSPIFFPFSILSLLFTFAALLLWVVPPVSCRKQVSYSYPISQAESFQYFTSISVSLCWGKPLQNIVAENSNDLLFLTIPWTGWAAPLLVSCRFTHVAAWLTVSGLEDPRGPFARVSCWWGLLAWASSLSSRRHLIFQ